MREIKFRAWEIDSKSFIYLDLYDLPDELFGRHGVLQNTVIKQWQQFTGLKDKNGKEIYEGDILLHFDKKYIVQWSEEMAAFQSVNPKDSVDTDFFNWGNVPSLETKGVSLMWDGRNEGNCEVIGNIYENKELLK